MILPVIPPAHSGAGQRGLRMAAALVRRGVSVVIVTHTPNSELADSPHIPVFVLKRWADRYAVTSGNRWRRFRTALAAVLTVSDAVSLMLREKPDVVYQLGCYVGPQLSGFAAWLCRVPVVAEATLIESDDPVTVRQTLGGALRHALLRKHEAFVAISPNIYEVAVASGLDPTRCALIGNDVDVQRFRPSGADEKAILRKALELPDEGPLYVSVGRMSPRKGMLELARAFLNDVLPVIPSARLVLVGPPQGEDGDAAYGEQLKYLASQSASNRVMLVGEVHDAAPWMRAADAFAFASRFEGFPNVLTEAMACGLPIATTALGGTSRFILGSAPGIEVVLGDDELGPAMIRLHRFVGDEETAAALHDRARRQFSADVIHEKYHDLFTCVATPLRNRS